MWTRDEWLVPHVNGAPYPDKPPVLFWLVLLGWKVTGVSEWWPRLIAPLAALLDAALTVTLARRLWPDRPGLGRHSIAFLFGALWAAYSTILLFDFPLSTCVLLGVLGTIDAWRGRPLRGWTLAGLALGLGILTKGPIALLHILPAGLTAPWWARAPRPPSWPRWYAGLAAAVALGAALALAWAIPAAAHGGRAYGDAILWHQTAGRMVRAFAHERPIWWYLPLLPLMVFPWSLWPPLWRDLRTLAAAPAEPGVRLAMAWLGVVLVGLALISGKQMHYVVPLVPAFALLAARATAAANPAAPARRRDAVPTAVMLVVLAAVVAALAGGAFAHRLPPWVSHVAWSGAVLLLAGAGALLVPRTHGRQRAGLAASAALTFLVFHLAVIRPGRAGLDLAPVATWLRDVEGAGRPIAHVGRYAGQYHFLGRLRRPFAVLAVDSVAAWAARHPDGVVACLKRARPDDSPALLHPYVDRWFVAYDAPQAAGCGPGS
jgi:4-amino-4-deoxy-L-arabinose transferase-like glycosyltransferase